MSEINIANSIVKHKQKERLAQFRQNRTELTFLNNEIDKTSSNKSRKHFQGKKFKYGKIKSTFLTSKGISVLNKKQITKSSNYDTNSNISYEYEFEDGRDGNIRLNQIEQNQKQQFGVVNYDKMTMQDIKHEFHRLRQQVATLNQQIRSKQQLYKSKMMKKTIKTIASADNQKKIVQLQKNIYQNDYILNRLRLDYQQVQKRSNLANSSISKPNADMNQKMVQLRQRILTFKEKIQMLRRKSRKTGNDIVNAQNVHDVMQKLQRQQKSYLVKHAGLQGKLQESSYKIQSQDQKLTEIQQAYSQAQDYLKLFKLQNQQQVQKNSIALQMRQRQNHQQIIRKKIQSDQQTFLQRYHQLLKGFELQAQKLEKIDKRLISTDVEILRSQNIVLDLQEEWDQLEDLLQTLNEQQELRKQAQSLRQLVQSQSRHEQNTFMTGQGFAVKSIIQENESQLRQTIQMDNQKQTIEKHNKVRVKDRLLFTKIEEPHYMASKIHTPKRIESEFSNLTGKNKYYLPKKQVCEKRQQSGNLTSLRKIGPINDHRSVRKVSSMLKTDQTTKLKQLPINRATNNSVTKERNIHHGDSVNSIAPQNSKQPHVNHDKTSHQQQIKKGKHHVRQRKNSLKIGANGQKQQKIREKDLLNKPQQKDQQLQGQKIQLGQGTKQSQSQMDQEKARDQTGTLDHAKLPHNKNSMRNSKQNERLMPLSRQSNRSQENMVKPSSKSGKIRCQQVNAIKPQVLTQIDKTNTEYNRKVQELIRQVSNNQMCNSSDAGKVFTQQNNKQTRKHNDQGRNLNVSENGLQDLQMKKDMITPAAMQRFNSKEQKDTGNQMAIAKNQEQWSDEELEDDQDDDVQQDISQINKMIKKKLQNQGLKLGE